MANTKVTGDVIANGTISTVHLADDAITAAKLDSTATGITFADLTVDTDTLYVDAANNRVGIGETSPLSKLHIKVSDTGVTSPSAQGNLLVLEDSENGLSILSSTAGAGYINFGDSDDNDVGMIIYGHSSNSMDFWTNAGKRMTIDSSGNVGIGIPNPSDYYSTANDLVVGGSSNHGITIATGTTSTGALHFADGTSGAAEYAGYIAYQHNDNKMRFGINASDKLVIDSSGNVGIGTTSGDVFGRFYARSVSINSTGVSKLQINSATGQYAGIDFGVNGTRTADINSSASSLNLNTIGAIPMTFITNGTERMRIDSSGNVGIGTTTPSGKLNVFGATGLPATSGTTFTGTMRLQVAGYGTTLDFGAEGPATGKQWLQATDASDLSITYPLLLNPNGGNVGIGTTSPAVKLEVAETVANTDAIVKIKATRDAYLQFAPANTTKWALIADYPALGDFTTYNYPNNFNSIICKDNKDIITNTGGGNFGIGTTSPSEKLEVSGVIKSISTGAAKLILNGDTNNSGDTGQEDAIIDFLGDGNPGIYGYRINTENWSGQTALHFQEYINGSYTSRLKIDKDGNVGIGTTSPSKTLSVNGEIFQKIRLNLQRGSTGATTLIQFLNEVGTDRAHIDFGGTNEELSFFAGAGSSEHMRITSAGNVGIGNTVASAKLQIHNTNAGAGAVAAFLVNASTSVNTETRLAFAAHTNDDIATNRYSYISTINTSGSNGQDMIFATNPTGSAASERMRITSGGKTLIGMTSQQNAGTLQIDSGASSNGGILDIAGSGWYRYYTRVCRNATSVSQAGYWHIKTNIAANSNTMFLAKFYGYIYGSAQVLDLTHAGYAYSATSTVINQGTTNNGSDPNASSAIYISANGSKVTFRIAFGTGSNFSTYFAGVFMDIAFPNPAGQGHDFEIEAQSFSTNTTLY